MIYNFALGGNCGATMDLDKINSQYSIGIDKYDEFMLLFNQNKTQLEISKIMNVGKNSVIGCAKRLSLSFRDRRKNCEKNKISSSKYTDEERRSIWSENIISVNKKRGISEDLKNEIIHRYFKNNETSNFIEKSLKIKSSTIRGVVHREYKLMNNIDRQDIKKTRASIVRTGIRNSNYNKLKIINENL